MQLPIGITGCGQLAPAVWCPSSDEGTDRTTPEGCQLSQTPPGVHAGWCWVKEIRQGHLQPRHGCGFNAIWSCTRVVLAKHAAMLIAHAARAEYSR